MQVGGHLMSKKIFFPLALIIIALAFIHSSEAALLGVNRASLTYSDVLRGGYAEQQIVVTAGTPQNVQVFYEARGEISDWIRFEPEEEYIIVNEDNPGNINIIVEPPSDARVDVYEGIIMVMTGPLGEITSTMGTNIVVAFEVKITVNITDTQILRCTAGGFSLSDAEVNDPVKLSANIRNNGNVRVRPSFELNIYDQFQENQVLEYRYRHHSEVLPTKTLSPESDLELGLQPGQYWAEITEPVCGQSALVTFSVLERGGISDVGELVRINNNPWAVTGEIIPITASFRNRGERTVSAQFKGIVSIDGRIVQVLESPVIDVPRGELASLEMFFSPEDPGQYKISGRVHYNQKITFEKGSIVNVNPSGEQEKEGFDLILLLFIGVMIITFLLVVLIVTNKSKSKSRIL